MCPYKFSHILASSNSGQVPHILGFQVITHLLFEFTTRFRGGLGLGIKDASMVIGPHNVEYVGLI